VDKIIWFFLGLIAVFIINIFCYMPEINQSLNDFQAYQQKSLLLEDIK